MFLVNKLFHGFGCRIIFCALICCFLSISINTSGQPDTIIRGIYGNPRPFWERGYTLSELGVNAVFVHAGSIDQEMIDKARQDGLKVYAEFPTLNGKN
jgi:hypothetical protein